MRRFIMCAASVLLAQACQQTSNEPVHFTNALKDTNTPLLFYPGQVSLRNTVHYNSSFDDTGDTIVYTRKGEKNRSVASYQNFVDGVFTEPMPIAVDNTFAYGDPHISANGNKVLLSSNRPDQLDSSEGQVSHLWQFTRNANGSWGSPEKLKLEMDYLGGFGYPSLTQNETLYFQYFSASDRNMDIFRTELIDGKYNKPTKLPDHISGKEFDGDPFIDRQERFLIFAGFNREGSFGLSDLYISFKRNNMWSIPINLGSDINSHGYDGSPYVTPDDKFLIFTSSRHPEQENEQEKFNVFYVNFDLERYKKMAVFKS